MIYQRLAWKKFRDAVIRYVPIQPFLWIAFSLIFRIPIIQPVTLAFEGALLLTYAEFALMKPESIRPTSPKVWIVLVWLLAVLPLSFLFVLRYAVIPITREADLVWIEWNPRGSFALGRDLSISNPGDETKECVIEVFAGTFDGNDWTITGLTIPFICLIESEGIVHHLKFQEVNIHEGLNVGAVAKENKGSIQFVEVTGSLMGEGYIGGLVGVNRGRIENSRFEGDVTGLYIAGGMVGMNGGTIQRSQVFGTARAEWYLGGFVGWDYGGLIIDCVSDIDLSGAQWVGGIVGKTTNRGSFSVTWEGPAVRVLVLGSLSGTNVGVLNADQNGNGYLTLFGGIIHSDGHEVDEFEAVLYVLDQAFFIPESMRFDAWETDDFFYTNYLGLDPSVWDWNTESGIPVLR